MLTLSALLILFSSAGQAVNAPAEPPSINCPIGSAVIRIRIKDYDDMAASVIQSSGNFMLDTDAEQEAIGKMLQSEIGRGGDYDQKPRTFRVTFLSPDCSEKDWPFKLKPFQKKPFVIQIEEVGP